MQVKDDTLRRICQSQQRPLLSMVGTGPRFHLVFRNLAEIITALFVESRGIMLISVGSGVTKADHVVEAVVEVEDEHVAGVVVLVFGSSDSTHLVTIIRTVKGGVSHNSMIVHHHKHQTGRSLLTINRAQTSKDYHRNLR